MTNIGNWENLTRVPVREMLQYLLRYAAAREIIFSLENPSYGPNSLKVDGFPKSSSHKTSEHDRPRVVCRGPYQEGSSTNRQHFVSKNFSFW